ncbi:hypothetical protein O0L34_g3779 [Tuta absoluta]|nr:hypothetical protein O0L34_g3779 [Tuta absoluta]
MTTDSSRSLIVPVFGYREHGCKEFRCKQREFCVSSDLACDGVDHCADGSDEDTASLCPETGGSGASSAWMVVGAGIAALTTLVATVAVCCLCRRRAANQRTHLHLQQMSSSNGAGAGKLDQQGSETRLPGNWAHPAGPRGYRAARPGRLRARASR